MNVHNLMEDVVIKAVNTLYDRVSGKPTPIPARTTVPTKSRTATPIPAPPPMET